MAQSEETKKFIKFINWVLSSWVGWIVIGYTAIKYGYWVYSGRFYSVLDALVALFFFLVGSIAFLLLIYASITIIKNKRKE